MKSYKPLAVLGTAFLCAVFGTASLGSGSTSTGFKPSQRQTIAPNPRPREAWVLRSVLDSRTRVLSIALHNKLWLAYNTQTASLYKAWSGKIDFNGPVYTSSHGPQPISTGITYMEEPDENPWRIEVNGKQITPEVNYKGHTVLNNQVVLKYELAYQGQKILVEEKPDFFEAGNGKAGYERVFTVKNIPTDAKLSVNMHLASMLATTDYSTDGKFVVSNQRDEAIQNQAFKAIDGKLTLNNMGKTTFSIHLTPKPEHPLALQTMSRSEMIANLFAKSDCNTCHNQDVKTVGPSYKAIAERYENNEQNRSTLIAKVIKGGAGNWGQIPMSPHPTLKKEDADAMVSYIMSLDAAKEREQAAGKLMPRPAYKIILKAEKPNS